MPEVRLYKVLIRNENEVLVFHGDMLRPDSRDVTKMVPYKAESFVNPEDYEGFEYTPTGFKGTVYGCGSVIEYVAIS
jgi:hypothetical protein